MFCIRSVLVIAPSRPLIVKVQTRPTIGIAAARRPGILRSGSVLGKPNGSLAPRLHRTRPASWHHNYGGTSSHSRLVGAGLGSIYSTSIVRSKRPTKHRAPVPGLNGTARIIESERLKNSKHEGLLGTSIMMGALFLSPAASTWRPSFGGGPDRRRLQLS